MSTEDTQHGFPDAEAEALVGKILEEVRSIRDPAVLNACRSLFRSRVPFHLRSYAAAALILRALGVSAVPSRTRPADAPRARPAVGSRSGKRAAEASPEKAGPVSGKGDQAGPVDSPDLRIRKGQYMGEGTSLFFSMGRRQRFTAQNVLRILSAISGIEESDVGAVRTFDNYTFVNVHPAAADLIIQDSDGTLIKGRKLTVNRARPRKEESRAGKPDSRGEGGDGMDEGEEEPATE